MIGLSLHKFLGIGIGTALLSTPRLIVVQWPTPAALGLVGFAKGVRVRKLNTISAYNLSNSSEMPGKLKRVCIVGSGNW